MANASVNNKPSYLRLSGYVLIVAKIDLDCAGTDRAPGWMEEADIGPETARRRRGLPAPRSLDRHPGGNGEPGGRSSGDSLPRGQPGPGPTAGSRHRRAARRPEKKPGLRGERGDRSPELPHPAGAVLTRCPLIHSQCRTHDLKGLKLADHGQYPQTSIFHRLLRHSFQVFFLDACLTKVHGHLDGRIECLQLSDAFFCSFGIVFLCCCLICPESFQKR